MALHGRERSGSTASVAAMPLTSHLLSTAFTVEGAEGSFQSDARTRHGAQLSMALLATTLLVVLFHIFTLKCSCNSYLTLKLTLRILKPSLIESSHLICAELLVLKPAFAVMSFTKLIIFSLLVTENILMQFVSLRLLFFSLMVLQVTSITSLVRGLMIFLGWLASEPILCYFVCNLAPSHVGLEMISASLFIRWLLILDSFHEILALEASLIEPLVLLWSAEEWMSEHIFSQSLSTYHLHVKTIPTLWHGKVISEVWTLGLWAVGLWSEKLVPTELWVLELKM